MGHRVSSLLPALLLGAVVLLVGCAADGNGIGTAPTAVFGNSPGGPRTDLRISIRADGTDESAHYHLLCSGAAALGASVHPRADEACELVTREPRMLAKPAPDAHRSCTQQYAGPATAEVSGTLEGQVVARSFDLHDGCGIADWDAAMALLVDQPMGQ